MRYLKPVSGGDHELTTRTHARWFTDELGLRIVEYHLGNAFTGAIDLLATDDRQVYLITVGEGRLEDALLRALTGAWWFQANLAFLQRGYPKQEIDLTLPVVLMICASSFPHEASSICAQTLKLPVRLFRAVLLGAAEDPDLYIEELTPSQTVPPKAPEDLAALRVALGIEKAGVTDEEIREFRTAMAGTLR